jgi:hypothetical protein
VKHVVRAGAAFAVQAGVALLLSGLLVLTMVWPEWIEGVFGVDPDHHSGSLEWLIVVALGLAVAASALLAGRQWRRAVPGLNAHGL